MVAILATAGLFYSQQVFLRLSNADFEDFMKRILLIASVWVGQGVPAFAAEASPADPAATAPPVAYRSAFEGYRPFKEEPIVDWRKLNAEVGAVGGHVGIMGGAGGHAGHGAKAAPGKAAGTEGGQPPVRGAPKAPGGGAQTPKEATGGAHSQH